MTDEQIIKALPLVAYGGHSCMNCKYKIDKGEERCGLKGCNIARNALDLINRLKAKNKEFDEKIVIQMGTIDWQAKEINRLKAEVERFQKLCQEQNAVKEFAERLKERMFNYYECLSESAKGRPYKGDTLMDYEVVDMIEDSIDNLVKEMVGEKDG